MQKKPLEHLAEKTKVWSGYFAMLLGLLLVFAVLRSAFFGDVPEEKHVWIELTLLLLVAVLAERLVEQWRQPLVMVLLLLGVAISPHTLAVAWPPVAQMISPFAASMGLHPNPEKIPNLVTNNDLIYIFGQLGAILLLFRIGLHSKLEQVFNARNFAIAAGGVTVPFVLGFAFAIFSGGNFGYAMFLGAALTATSVGITVAVLEEMKLLGKPFAQAIIGAAVIDDILALMVLAVVKSTPTEIGASSIMPFASVLAVSVLFVVCGIAFGKFFVRAFFSDSESEISKRTLAGFLAIAFFYAFAAESLGLSAIVGAFLAGLVISYSPMAEKLNKSLFPLDVLFTPIFFISLGLLVDIFAIPGIFVPLIIVSLLAIAGKIIGCALPAKLSGFTWKESLTVGWGMVPRGEIALIIALLGLQSFGPSGNPVLTQSEYTLIASMAFITTLVVPFGLNALAKNKFISA